MAIKCTCSNCGHTRYQLNGELYDGSRCNECNSLKFGLIRKTFIESYKCPRCGDRFIKDNFKVCGGCLTDMGRTHKGLPPTHYKTDTKTK